MMHMSMKDDALIGRSALAWFCTALCVAWFFFSVNPLNIYLSENPYNHKRLLQIGFLCLVTMLFFVKEYRTTFSIMVTDGLPYFFWGISVTFVVLSSAASDNPLHSSFESLHWVLLICIFVFGFYLARAGMSSVVIVGLLICHALVAFKALLFLSFEVLVSHSLRASLLYPDVAHYRFFNQVQVFIISLLYIFAIRTSFKKMAYAFLFINLLLAFCGGARGLTVSIVSGGILAYFLLKTRRPEIRVALLLFLAAYMGYEVIGLYVDEVAHSSDVLRAHTSGRFNIWQGLVGSLSYNHLLFGEGAGAYSYHSFSRIEGHPHNSVLQFIYEWGMLGTISGLVGVGLILYRSWRVVVEKEEIKRGTTDAEAGILVAVLSGVIYSFFSGIVVMPLPQTLLFLLLGMFWGGILKEKNIKFKSVPLIASIFGRVLLCLTLVVFVLLASRYFLQQTEPQKEYKGPRFWAEGVHFKG